VRLGFYDLLEKDYGNVGLDRLDHNEHRQFIRNWSLRIPRARFFDWHDYYEWASLCIKDIKTKKLEIKALCSISRYAELFAYSVIRKHRKLVDLHSKSRLSQRAVVSFQKHDASLWPFFVSLLLTLTSIEKNVSQFRFLDDKENDISIDHKKDETTNSSSSNFTQNPHTRKNCRHNETTVTMKQLSCWAKNVQKLEGLLEKNLLCDSMLQLCGHLGMKFD